MDLSKQVVSLELAKELKEQGYPQEGLWWWNYKGKYPNGKWGLVRECVAQLVGFVAPTVAELGERLPDQYHSWKSILDDTDMAKGWLCVRFSEPEFDNSDEHWISSNTEANARAKMWLYLRKEKLI